MSVAVFADGKRVNTGRTDNTAEIQAVGVNQCWRRPTVYSDMVVLVIVFMVSSK